MDYFEANVDAIFSGKERPLNKKIKYWCALAKYFAVQKDNEKNDSVVIYARKHRFYIHPSFVKHINAGISLAEINYIKKQMRRILPSPIVREIEYHLHE